jgi:hypothetical protein
MNILNTTGLVKVETVVGKNLGIVTGAIIRGQNVCYEVSLFLNGEYRKVELIPKEFKIIGDKQEIKIGFKNE